MFGSRIVIADEDLLFRKILKEMLQRAGYAVVQEAGDGQSALRAIRAVEPDLVILNAYLPLTDGFEVAKILEEGQLAPVILIANQNRRDLLQQAKKTAVMAVLLKPLSEESLLPAVELAFSNFARIVKLRKEVNDLKHTLASRKVIEKAKGILMNQLKISEEEAFKRIQQQSMRSRTTMKAIADAIIVAHEIEK